MSECSLIWIHENGPASPQPSEPSDYKFLCFDGEPRLIEVHQGRSTNHTQDMLWPDWTSSGITQPNMPCSKDMPAKPAHLDEMSRLSSVLSAGIPHVRVDWYDRGVYPLFGEMTFYDGAGFGPFDSQSDDELLGSWIELEHAYGTN